MQDCTGNQKHGSHPSARHAPVEDQTLVCTRIHLGDIIVTRRIPARRFARLWLASKSLILKLANDNDLGRVLGYRRIAHPHEKLRKRHAAAEEPTRDSRGNRKEERSRAVSNVHTMENTQLHNTSVSQLGTYIK